MVGRGSGSGEGSGEESGSGSDEGSDEGSGEGSDEGSGEGSDEGSGEGSDEGGSGSGGSGCSSSDFYGGSGSSDSAREMAKAKKDEAKAEADEAKSEKENAKANAEEEISKAEKDQAYAAMGLDSVFDVAKTYKSTVWCGPSDGMLTKEKDCKAAAAERKVKFASKAGTEWHAGCIIHNGGAYFVPLTKGASHSKAVNGGYLCQNNKTHKQKTWCGANDGLITSKAACKTAAQAAGIKFASQAGAEWHAGCIINNGGAYFVPLTKKGAHSKAVNGGYLCNNGKAAAPAAAPGSDCRVKAWGKWGSCSKPCGGGEQFKHRSLVNKSNKSCKVKLTESKPCNTKACPINCAVTAWEKWGACSKKCGSGSRTRKREINTPALAGGKACPKLSQTEKCNTQPCPVHCQVSSWGKWTSCSKKCGGGTTNRKRTVITVNKFGGTSCPKVSESKACNTKHCPVNCVVSPWAGWPSCSKTCGGGAQTTTRSVMTAAKYGGRACPALSKTQKCHTQSCPVHCQLSSWNSWESCSRKCGGGVKSRSRSVTRQPQFGVLKCGALKMKAVCNTNPCPVNCQHSAWGAWGKCSKSCGGGTKSKTRTITQQALHGGKKCENTRTSTTCNTAPCPVDCKVSAWGGWGGCSKACGTGLQKRARRVSRRVANGGKTCPKLEESKKCNTNPCPVNCAMKAWGSWAKCSKTCAGGTQRRTRGIKTQPLHGGKGCLMTSESRGCNTQACPVKWVKNSPRACRESCQSGAYTSTGSYTCKDAGSGATLSDSKCTSQGKAKPKAPTQYCRAGPRCGCNNILCGGSCCWLLWGRYKGHCTMCVGGHKHVWPWTCGTSRQCT